MKMGRTAFLGNVRKFRGGGKKKRSFTGKSRESEKREDRNEGAWYYVSVIGCDGSEAFTRIYECLF